MSAALHLCGPSDLERLLALSSACRDETHDGLDAEALRAVLEPLLRGLPQGAAYLIGPRLAPVGHVILSFGYAVRLGGLVAGIDEFYIRPALRGRGMGGDVLGSLAAALSGHGVRALRVEVPAAAAGRALFTTAGFRPHEVTHRLIRMIG